MGLSTAGGPEQGDHGRALARALRHDRLIVGVGLATVVALCWAYLVSGAGVMDGSALASPGWSAGYAVLMAVMWVLMMMAMMLPSAAPVILLYLGVVRGSTGGSAITRGSAFATGYVAVWTLFSLMAVALQYGLEQATLLSPMMRTGSVALAGSLLIAAGVYQWTPLKHACLRHCRSPLDFLVTHWRSGPGGALRMGVVHGAYCLGCCWVLMLLLFVGGVMNLLWIAGLAVFVLLEKLVPRGEWTARLAGAGLVVWGTMTLLSAGA